MEHSISCKHQPCDNRWLVRVNQQQDMNRLISLLYSGETARLPCFVYLVGPVMAVTEPVRRMLMVVAASLFWVKGLSSALDCFLRNPCLLRIALFKKGRARLLPFQSYLHPIQFRQMTSPRTASGSTHFTVLER